MAISIADSFNRTTALPRFADEVFDTIADRDDYLVTLRYEGLLVYVKEDQTSYRLKGGVENENWVVDGGGGSGSGVIRVEDYIEMLSYPEEDREEGMIFFVADVKENWQLQGGVEDEDFVQLYTGSGRGKFSNPLTLDTSGAIAAENDLVVFDVSGGNVTGTLPVITEIGQCVLLKRDIDATDNVATIAAGAGNDIEGESSDTLPYPGDYMELTSITLTRWGKTT